MQALRKRVDRNISNQASDKASGLQSNRARNTNGVEVGQPNTDQEK